MQQVANTHFRHINTYANLLGLTEVSIKFSGTISYRLYLPNNEIIVDMSNRDFLNVPYFENTMLLNNS